MNISPPGDNLGHAAATFGRVSVGVKAGVALGVLVAIAAIPKQSPLWLTGPFVIAVAIIVFGRIPLFVVFKRLLAFEVLAVTTSILALFQPDGWRLFWVLVAKATLSLVIAILFSLSVSFTELLALLRRLRIPRLFVTTIALLYRYLFVLTDQAARMTRARASRSFLPTKRRMWIINSGIIGTLALRSVERAEHVYNAMRARGWR